MALVWECDLDVRPQARTQIGTPYYLSPEAGVRETWRAVCIRKRERAQSPKP